MAGSGVTEYIGPIVAPHWEGDWTNTTTYTPLAMVTYQGNSFMSRQNVPIGASITNQKFWVEVGNYNAQVEEYRQTVLTFDTRITANANAISEETLSRTNADENLQSQLNPLKEQLNTLQEQLKTLYESLKSGRTYDQLKTNGFVYREE